MEREIACFPAIASQVTLNGGIQWIEIGEKAAQTVKLSPLLAYGLCFHVITSNSLTPFLIETT